jgi:hypothetical protein
MKRLILICSVFISLNAFGQFNTGSVYFSGITDASIGTELVSSFTGETTFNLPFGLYIEGGYFIQNRMAVGGSIHSHGSFGFGEFNSSEFEFRFGPNFRYYLPREDDLNLYLYAHPYYGFWVASGSGIYGNNHGIFLGGGTNYFISESIALEGRIAYNLHRAGSAGAYTTYHRLQIEFGISVFFSSIDFLNVK